MDRIAVTAIDTLIIEGTKGIVYVQTRTQRIQGDIGDNEDIEPQWSCLDSSITRIGILSSQSELVV